MGEQRTGPEALRFLAWQLELHMGTISGRTTSDKLRTYANIWEAETATLKRENTIMRDELLAFFTEGYIDALLVGTQESGDAGV